MAELQDGLPSGWSCKVDQKTGKRYYINHYTRTTTWEDPRSRHRYHGTPLHVTTGQSEYIPLQHGSPDLRRNSVYPSQPSPIPAFQMPGQYSPKFIPLQDMRPSQGSPLSVRMGKVQDSSFTNVPDTDESVMKISSMFPTVSDTHIRLLLKKYHNREAVVISALQVEKHPIVTPGPFPTPPPARNVPLQMTPPPGVRTISRTNSPILRFASCTNSTYMGSPSLGDAHRNSPRPHPSPKLKLRYMKSIFPEAEETIILDVLSSNENNIQRASDNLKEMGFVRKDTVKIKQQEADAKLQEEKLRIEISLIPEAPPVLPKLKTKEEKQIIKISLQNAYKDIPEHVINIALESVHFDEERANKILQIMVQEDNKMKETNDRKNDSDELATEAAMEHLALPTTVTTSQSRQSIKSLLKEKADNNKTSFSRVVEENNMNNSGYKSSNLSNTHGSNPEYAKGANEKLLLEEYINWQGPNPNFYSGSNRSLAKGSDKSLLSKKIYKPCGSNPELRKGPMLGLAKGSIFSQLKCIATGESRGK